MTKLAPQPAARTKTSARSQPTKAYIRCLDMPPPPGVPPEIQCQFNPAQITFERTAQWTDDGAGATQTDVPPRHFSGGSGSTLSMDLFFDTTEEDHKDVRDYTDPLIMLTKINPLAGVAIIGNLFPKRPPLVMFVWGEFGKSAMSFRAYITSASITFSMFLPDGTPVRAETKITFTEFEDDTILPFQNPTSRSEQRKQRIVQAGETIDWIASQEYGDARHWRHIADTNDLDDPSDLRPGQVLRLSSLNR